ncbi:MAG TPA: hypothetical protein CFH78_04730 [Sulfurimonas sp. UBA10385]|nr:MAG TPA: hypothetical protein CFH78_04730 [Sulfurimonas sp. UBA10385]
MPKKEAVIDDTLPVVTLTKNGTIVDVNAIALEWAPIDDQRVKGIYVYRVNVDAIATSSSDEYYDTVESRFSTHYLDTKIEPSSKYGYSFKTYSDDAESRRSKVTVIASLPAMESVTWIHSVGNMPRSAKIIWRPHTNEKVKAYIIQRRTLQEDSWKNLATINGRLNAEYIDKNLKDNFTYKYRIQAITYDNITSNPSQEVSVVTKELPKELTQITASKNLPKRVEIKWEKSDVKDFFAYRLYKSSSINGNYKVVIETKENSYIDMIEEDGKEYFYRVGVVDNDKLESVNKNYSVLGKTLVKPNTPSLVEVKLLNGKVKMSWISSDTRVKSFSVQKRYKKNLLENSIEDFENIKGLEFTDSEIDADKVYYYKVFAVDANGIKSEPSIEAELKIDAKSIDQKSVEKTLNTIERNFKPNNQKSIGEPNKDVIIPMQDFN